MWGYRARSCVGQTLLCRTITQTIPRVAEQPFLQLEQLLLRHAFRVRYRARSFLRVSIGSRRKMDES